MKTIRSLSMMLRLQNEKIFFITILLALVLLLPIPAISGVDIGISLSLPPPIVFATPPEVIVIPETYVYAVPGIDVDIFFHNGWWWRPWEGRWYRSRHHDKGWAHYQKAPSFYARIPSSWRNDYRDRRWGEHQWNSQRIPHQQLQRNWSNWEKNRHWEKQQTWGVQGLKPRTQSQQPSRVAQPKNQPKPQFREAPTPQQTRQQSRDVRPQRSQAQHRDVPQQPKPRQRKPEREQEEKQDRK